MLDSYYTVPIPDIPDKGFAKCIWPLSVKSIGIPEDDVKQSTKLLKWDVAYTLRQFLPRCRRQTRSSDENSVCMFVRPSVCLSVKRVNYDKKDEKSARKNCPYFYTIRKIEDSFHC